MDYTASIRDLDSRQRLSEAAMTAASIAVLVEPQPTLNPAQRKAIERLANACNGLRTVFEPVAGA